jgi:hypothetical protein
MFKFVLSALMVLGLGSAAFADEAAPDMEAPAASETMDQPAAAADMNGAEAPKTDAKAMKKTKKTVKNKKAKKTHAE